MAPGNLDSIGLDTTADRFAALGDVTRLRIVRALGDGQRCVCELRNLVEVPPNLLSYHLKVLREAGVITGSRRGRWIDYRLVPGAIEDIGRALLGGLP